VTFQVGINDSADDRIVVGLTDVHASALGTTATLDTIDISTVAGAQTAMTVVDESIDDISSGRAALGASQNRLQVTITNLGSARENLSAANSRIRDVDVAQETAALTKHNILMQAGVSVLAQANQMPALALSLLG
jgi:flagellin